jgi:hypothetical protein
MPYCLLIGVYEGSQYVDVSGSSMKVGVASLQVWPDAVLFAHSGVPRVTVCGCFGKFYESWGRFAPSMASNWSNLPSHSYMM